jgi:uncharacterized protein (DUF486 family)
LAVPANRLGFVQFSGFQLKIIREVITISVFLGVAAFFAFAFKAPKAAL